ncbi:MAG: glycosyltransferase [Proteobacteria bacterium]|nr:glycosyltransferase [Pseudomonadota bacterium]
MNDVVFLGRFHPQKGVKELMHIWAYVNQLLPDATLVMIGNGELFKECQAYNMRNVTLKGFMYGEERNEVIKECRVAVHPAVYDSGGMALAECMAFGMPGVSFDLPSLRTYYSRGVVKVPCFSNEAFAMAIVDLLTCSDYYEAMSKEADEYINSEWKWDKRAESIWNDMMRCLSHPQADKFHTTDHR